MPRISHNKYIERHTFLAHAWEHYRTLFATVSPSEQRDLHRFYATAQELDELALVRYRKRVTKQDPSLPHRTGKSFAVMYQAFCLAFELAGGEEAAFHGAIAWMVDNHVHHSKLKTLAIVQPELDLKQLAEALLEVVQFESWSRLTRARREA